ncbi:MAG: EF-P lysine aminoacylase GenX [Gammaproteobacteria bacterium]|nr:EF-P lysine aminoacylase GenX [Gammaproteobacteria bacterium]
MTEQVTDWQPTATLAALRQRAELLARLRRYFAGQGVLEVETPLLSSAGIPDPHIPSFTTTPGPDGEASRYLNTSPEFAMKRLLAAGSGPIFQVCKAFRRGEQGKYHNPEFTLLEWYRPGFDHLRLMDEVDVLVRQLAEGHRSLGCSEKLSYQACFQRYLEIDPFNVDVSMLKSCAQVQGLGEVAGLSVADKDTWLDLLMSHCVQPHLGKEGPVFVYDYPASQAALARIRPVEPPVAERFELFIDGIELANGFHELQDAHEQRERFEADLVRRQVEKLEPVALDERLLRALSAGLPACAGVALGLDRLQLVLTDCSHIRDALAFPYERS